MKETPESDRSTWYREQADSLWESMPEIAGHEKEYVIFCGVLPANHTRLIITRIVEGRATFRLLHERLDKLQGATTALVKDLLDANGNLPHLGISYEQISIYERGFDHIIIHGRVIPNVAREAWRVDKRNVLLAAGGLFFAIPCLVALLWLNSTTNAIVGGTLERASTAFLTTTIVSLIGFLQTYLDVRSAKLIDWTVATKD